MRNNTGFNFDMTRLVQDGMSIVGQTKSSHMAEGGGVIQILENTKVTFLRTPSVSSYSKGSVMSLFFLAGLSAGIK